jgi:hypothetical protein
MSIENFEHIPEQPEDVPGRLVSLTMGWIVTGIILCTFVVWWMMSGDASGGGRSNEIRTSLVPPTYVFEAKTPLERAREAQLQHLESWSWADKDHQIVRVPAEVAIDRYLGGRK